tara:strand:+ start:2270 stop:2938 length:669 start_codon:yes stop_codon:yes gene_type:complete
MMLPGETQAVTGDVQNSDTPSEGNEDDGRAAGARDEDLSLDELLEQSQAEDDSEPEQIQVPADPPDMATRLAILEKDNEDNRRRDAQTLADAAINSAATEIKGLDGDLENVPERAIKGYLYAFAEEKPEVLRIFTNRDSNPQAWNKLKRSMAKEIAADLGGSGSDELAAGIQAAQDAVRGVSHKVATSDSDKPTNEALSEMTNDQFEAHKAELRKTEAAAAR